MAEFFADVLEKYIERHGVSIGRLATLTDIPKQTIQSWREGRVKRPRHIAAILQVARGLSLDVVDTDELLAAARHPSLTKVREKAKKEDDKELLNLSTLWDEDERKQKSAPSTIEQFRLPNGGRFTLKNSELVSITSISLGRISTD